MSALFIVRSGSYVSLLLAMLLFERLAPFTMSEQRKYFRLIFHLGINIANSVILWLTVAGPVYALIYYTQNHTWGIVHWVGLAGGAEIVATVVVFDLWDYWMHFLNHRVPFFWRFHKAHHSDMEVDVTTASRFHIGELVISSGGKCLMILVWGPSMLGLVAFEAILTGASQFHHSNVNIPLKIQDRLEKVIVTPRMHRCHHALHRNCFNTNFATILSPWDRLFGSYHWANDYLELEPLGVNTPRGEETMRLGPFFLTPIKVIE